MSSGGVPPEVIAVLGNLNSSNEARLALLEKRFTIPPSPAASREATSQITAAREGTPGPENGDPAAATWHSLDGLELSTDNLKKRRRTSLGPGAPPRGGGSPPHGSAALLLSPSGGDTGSRGAACGSPTSSRRRRNTISRYFSSAGGAHSNDGTATAGPHDAAARAQAQAALAAAEQQAAQLAAELEAARADAAAARAARNDAEERLAGAQGELATARQQLSGQAAHVRATVLRLARRCARLEREGTAQRLQAMGPRLGSLGVRRRGIEVQEVWDEGQAFKELRVKLAALSDQREAIEAARKVR